MRPSISVVLCTYNGEKYLKEQLSSITRQKLLPTELIVSDDGSTDNTIDIIHNFQKISDFPVSLNINKQRLGATKNFEQAILKARGDIIVLCDQDDIWREDKLEEIYKIFTYYPETKFTFSNAYLINTEGLLYRSKLWDKVDFKIQDRYNFSLDPLNQLKILLRRNVVTGATLAFSSTLLGIITPIPPLWIHDEWISLIATLHGYKGFAIDKTLIYYRIHPEQQVGIRFRDNVKKKIKLLKNKVYRVERECMKWIEAEPVFLESYRLDTSTLKQLNEKLNFIKFRIYLRHLTRLIRIYNILKKNYPKKYYQFADGLNSIIWDLIFPKLKDKIEMKKFFTKTLFQ